MKADFLDALTRHWEDAETLFLVGRFANADQLYGLAAECGLKTMMLAFGMPFNIAKDKPTLKDDCAHADGAWLRFESYRRGHFQGAQYALPTNNPFDNWAISDRYAHQSNFNLLLTQAHQAGANTVYQLVKQAQLDGII